MADAAAVPPGVAEAMVAFNLSPMRDMDPSWVPTLPNSSLIAHLSAVPRALSRYGHWLMAESGIAGRFIVEFSPRARLALMSRADLQSLLLHVGVALRGNDIRREIDSKRIRATREAIGPELHDFALRMAPLYGNLPSVDFASRSLGLKERCMLIGAIYACDATATADRAYLTRLCWKLPQPVAEPLLTSSWEERAVEPGAQLPPLVRRIIKDRFSKWLPLFAG
ncbi:MAG: SctK family type III secretion system sorting platform protein [Pseudomonadota bacterium]